MKSFALVACLALLPYSALAQTCYNPAGMAVTDVQVVPCANNPVRSICCFSNRTLPAGGAHENGNTADECLPNGICQNRFTFQGQPKATYWLEYCTDKDIESGNCMDICRRTRGSEGTSMITPCDGTNNSEQWCCGDTTACCANANADLVSFPKQFVGMINGTIASLATTATPTPSSTRTPSSASTPSNSSSRPTSSPSSAPQSTGLSTGAKAGIGIGAACGVLALIGVFFFARKALAWKREAARARAYDVDTPSYADLYPRDASKFEHSGFAPTELPANPPVELAAPEFEMGDRKSKVPMSKGAAQSKFE